MQVYFSQTLNDALWLVGKFPFLLPVMIYDLYMFPMLFEVTYIHIYKSHLRWPNILWSPQSSQWNVPIWFLRNGWMQLIKIISLHSTFLSKTPHNSQWLDVIMAFNKHGFFLMTSCGSWSHPGGGIKDWGFSFSLSQENNWLCSTWLPLQRAQNALFAFQNTQFTIGLSDIVNPRCLGGLTWILNSHF